MKVAIFFKSGSTLAVTKIILLLVLLLFTDQNLYPSFHYNTTARAVLSHSTNTFRIYNFYEDTAFIFPEIISQAPAPEPLVLLKPKRQERTLYPNRSSLLTQNTDTSYVFTRNYLLATLFPFHSDDKLRTIFTKTADSLHSPFSEKHPSADTASYHGFKIMGQGRLTEQQLHSFFLSNSDSTGISRLNDLILLYIDECRAEGVNHDVAFIQMCHETGFLRYDGTVKPEQNNFCGLGTVNENTPGESFETAREGIRAHIQHLKAYASKKSLSRELVDRRFHYVDRGAATVIKELTGKWAADPLYDKKIIGLIMRAENHTGKKLI